MKYLILDICFKCTKPPNPNSLIMRKNSKVTGIISSRNQFAKMPPASRRPPVPALPERPRDLGYRGDSHAIVGRLLRAPAPAVWQVTREDLNFPEEVTAGLQMARHKLTCTDFCPHWRPWRQLAHCYFGPRSMSSYLEAGRQTTKDITPK